MEQRRDTRVELDVPVEISQEGSPLRHGALLKNLSLGGMFLETDLRLPFRAPLIVRVHVTARDMVLLPAIVRWTCREGLGVQFGLLGARSTFLIVQLARSVAAPDERRVARGRDEIAEPAHVWGRSD